MSIVFVADLQAGTVHKRYSSFHGKNTCVLCKCMHTSHQHHHPCACAWLNPQKYGEKSKKGNGSKVECVIWVEPFIHFLRDNHILSVSWVLKKIPLDKTRHIRWKAFLMKVNLIGCWRKRQISNHSNSSVCWCCY